MASHSSILSWIIPWTEEPAKLQSTGSQRVRHDGIHAHLVSLLPHSRASSCFSLALALLILMWVPCVSHVKNHTFHLFSLCNFAILKHFLGLSVCIIMVPKRRPHPNPKTCEYDISCCKGELTLQMD